MTEADRDEKVARAYRALGGEEPPRALDEAILAASRRSRGRWRVPLSIAAVLVLAIGVTLRMLPPQPDAEPVALAPQVIETPRPAAVGAAAEARLPDAARALSAPRALSAAKPAEPALTPEAWLERIAELRKQGREREAQESLAEFRKRYPDYKIPEALTR